MMYRSLSGVQVAKKYNAPTPEDKILQDNLKEKGAIPNHIAIIMDGNGRWAKERGLARVAGHREGVNSVRDIVEVCGQLGIQYLTFYAFSTENWKRPKNEVSVLMRLLVKSLRNETDRLLVNNVQLRTIGDTTSLPKDVQEELLFSIEKTSKNTGLVLILALSYSGRWDIVNAVRKIVQAVEHHRLHSKNVTEEVISSYLTTNGIPDPDLLIRTSGEFRLSNFLLWELAYTEIHIARCYWPEFRRGHLYDAIRDYQSRERRFGLVSEQLTQPRSSGIMNVERLTKRATRA
jgi:undecaprenyl diphosphate synthase